MQSKTQTIHDAAFRATLEDAIATVEPFSAQVTRTCARRASGGERRSESSADGHTAVVEVDMRGKERPLPEKRIDRITTATGGIAARHPGFFVGEAGSISSGKALQRLTRSGASSRRQESGPCR